jgi:hypothetical protein
MVDEGVFRRLCGCKLKIVRDYLKFVEPQPEYLQEDSTEDEFNQFEVLLLESAEPQIVVTQGGFFQLLK